MKNYTPLSYLKIDIANSYGLDKKTFEERIQWFDDNKDNLRQLCKEADEPAQMYAGVLAYEDTCKGIPTGHLVGLDATCSG